MLSKRVRRGVFTQWAILASPLMVTTPLSNMQGCNNTNCNDRCQDCRPQDKDPTSGRCMGPYPGPTHGNKYHCPAKCAAGLTEEQEAILLNTEVISINQDVTPQGRPVTPSDSTVWSRHLSDSSTAFALYNEKDVAQPIDTIAIRSACRDPSGEVNQQCIVRDLWAKMNYTITTLPSKVTVVPHGTELFRVYS
jgi:hypothetical protein